MVDKGTRLPQKRFLTTVERQKRIESVLNRRGWSWYQLAKAMRREPSNVLRCFKDVKNPKYNPSLSILKDCAVALGVSVEFLIEKSTSAATIASLKAQLARSESRVAELEEEVGR